MKKNIMKKAFTLAEILIVLAIIGSIAALTVPSLYARINPDQKQRELGLKKAITEIDNATKMIIMMHSTNGNLEGVPYSASFSDTQSIEKLYGKYLSATKTCEGGTVGASAACFNNQNAVYGDDFYIDKSGNKQSYYMDFETNDGQVYVLADEMLLKVVDGYRGSCNNNYKAIYDPEIGLKKVNNICFVINIDVNGEKKPNRPGVDRFVIPIGKFGVKLNGVDP